MTNSGGMGLTGGIADVGSLYDVLAAIQDGHVSKSDTSSILDKYSEVRIQKWKEIIDPLSRANFGRIHNTGPEADEDRKQFFGLLNRLKQMMSWRNDWQT